MYLSHIGKILLIFLLTIDISLTVLQTLLQTVLNNDKTLNRTHSKYNLYFVSVVNLFNSFLFKLRGVLLLKVTRSEVILNY